MYSANFAKKARLVELIPKFIKEIRKRTTLVKPENPLKILKDQKFLLQLECKCSLLHEMQKKSRPDTTIARILLSLASRVKGQVKLVQTDADFFQE